MPRFGPVILLSFVSLGAFAQTLPNDEKIETLSHDLRTIGRIAEVSKNLDDNRQVTLAILDADIDSMRVPREDGTYRWASLQREEASRVKDEKTIEQVHTEKVLREVTVSAPNAYRVVVSVPHKRSLVSANNRVWVRNIRVDLTTFDGKTTHHELPVNAWVNPGDSNGVALPDIGKSVKATAELGVESGSKRAVAEVALVQAKLVDDPTSPYFPAVKRLLAIREMAAAKEIARGNLKNAVDEALLALPGELEKRNAEMSAVAEARRQAALSGAMKNGITVGDATPDVIAELNEVSRMLGGTIDDQAAARARLGELIAKLKPQP